MSQNPLGKVVDILVAIIALFFIPFMWVTGKTEQLENNYSRAVIDNFAERIAVNGYMTTEDYEDLVAQLSKTSRRYNIEFKHASATFEPEYDSGTFTGNVMEYMDEAYTDEILSAMDDHGAYLMELGDSFTVSISQVRVRKMNVLAGILFKTGNTHQEETVTISNIYQEGYQSFF